MRVQLNIVTVSVYVNLLLFVIYNLGRRNYLAVASTKVEQGKQVVHILSSHEVWHGHFEVEPLWDTYHRIPARNASIWWQIFLDLHMDLKGVWVEVKHDGLLHEPVLSVDLGSNLI